MPDQAHSLRALSGTVDRTKGPSPAAPRAAVAHGRQPVCGGARTIAVTSGKGGVGKTSLCLNLAILLARAGKRVVMLDADLGLANAHILLGISPRYTIENLLRGECSIRDCLMETHDGLRLIPGASGVAGLADMPEVGRRRLLAEMRTLEQEADVLLIDTGAGVSSNVLAFTASADETLVVATADPASIADAYAVIKMTRRENPDGRVLLVVNMAANAAEARAVAEKLSLVCRRFLHGEIQPLGFVPRDSRAAEAARQQRPFCVAFPGSPAAKAAERIAARLGYDGQHPHGPRGITGFLSRLALRRAGCVELMDAVA